MKPYVGNISIKDGKIESIDLKDETQKELQEIEQILAVRDMIDEHIKDREKNINRT